MKRALITGITWQDGAYLARFPLNKKYKVFGTYRKLSTSNFWRLHYLNILNRVKLIPCDLIDSGSIIEALELSNPHEIYNLAAQSFVGASFEQPISSGEITGLGVTRMLDAVRKACHDAKLYQASTSELYGDNNFETQNENTAFNPYQSVCFGKIILSFNDQNLLCWL